MTLTIELTPEQEARLQHAAQQQGKPLTAVVAALLDALPAEPANAMPLPHDGASLFAYWQQTDALGLFADRPEDAPELARKLRAQAEEGRDMVENSV